MDATYLSLSSMEFLVILSFNNLNINTLNNSILNNM